MTVREISLTLVREHRRYEDWYLSRQANSQRAIALLRRRLGFEHGMFGEEHEKARARISSEALAAWKVMLKEPPEDDPLLQVLAKQDGFIHVGVRVQRRKVEDVAKMLPIWSSWAEGVRGFGPFSLGIVVGHAGDLSSYPTVAKLWKRMGLALVDGQRQRKVAGDKDLAIAMGYAPRRRAAMFTIQEAMIKTGGEYADLYRLRKEEIEIPKLGEEGSRMHAHRRASRWMIKRLLRDLWCRWNREEVIKWRAAA